MKDALGQLPVLPAFKTGKGTQGIDFAKPLDNKAMAKRTRRLLKKYIKKIEKSTHHAIRKGFAQRMAYHVSQAAEANNLCRIFMGSCSYK